ncbi:MAG TPA: 23S rRNA (adenine(2503)-C(2))-methyltransferase RlmN [Anaerolineaceae bacterium]|nr:23S rRNA (adenine(2503)-C(2))-methyltransferase RlmN [Anaerolineaceae bacterium]
MENKPSIYDLDREQLTELILSLGEKPFRVDQIFTAVYHNYCASADEITPLSKVLRSKLSEVVDFQHLLPVKRLTSADGETVKTLFQLPDGLTIESVLMHYEAGETLCISSQAGCAMGCAFCATGQMGFKRNLSSGEIIEQVLYYARELASQNLKVTNIVVMGMGEPFLNYDAVMKAINRLNDPEAMNLGARRFTISTVGIVPMIEKFASEKSQINLAVSLHAANDELRDSLIPVNRKYPLEDILTACRTYVESTGRRITFEWALIQGINDRPEDARQLVQRVKGLNCHVNIIPLNPTGQFHGKPTTNERAQEFKRILEMGGVNCTIRLRRGIDIQAGCGQLAARHQLS